MSVAERERANAVIEMRALEYLRSRRPGIIHCYMSFRSEAETYDLIRAAMQEGIRVLVPVVNETGEMVQHELHNLQELRVGHLGLPVPGASAEYLLHDVDIVIVPLVAFDRHGNRLGYGKGFYDRFLSLLGPEVERVGLAFATQEVERIPDAPHDVPLHKIVTEHELIITDALFDTA